MNETPERTVTPREKLILAGIKVIEENGVSGFSIRRTAAAVSYTHLDVYKRQHFLSAFLKTTYPFILRARFLVKL